MLRAPVDAIVLEIANRTIGSIVREAETLFVLMPRDVPLRDGNGRGSRYQPRYIFFRGQG